MAEVVYLQQPWEGNDFMPTTEAMVKLWLEQLNISDEDFRFVGGQPHVYRNGIWQPDLTGGAVGCAVGEFCRRVGGDVKKRTVRGKVEDSKMHSGMLARARELLAIPVDDVDADPRFIGAPGRPWRVDGSAVVPAQHGKGNLVTKCLRVDPRPMATPIFDGFFARVVPDKAVRAFLLRFFGYCLTGLTREQCFLFLYGAGQNGKGVLADVVRLVMGSYAAIASIGLLTKQPFERHPEEFAQLRGVRLLVSDETDRGAIFDEARLKALTSGDRVRARLTHRDSFEYTPAFKIIVLGNNKPQLGDVGKAMRRRLLLVPFDVEITEEEKNRNLREQLEPEFPGILHKLLDGLRDYLKRGLDPPEAVVAATQEYIEEEDAIGAWIDERGIRSKRPDAFASIDELFKSYTQWAKESGEWLGKKKWLTQQLKKRGFKYGRQDDKRGFQGFKIAADGAGYEDENASMFNNR